MNVSILYRDDVLLAVDKPSSVLVHRGWGRDRIVLVDIVKEMLGCEVVHPLHRLDRQTSGVVVFALNSNIARTMSARFESGEIQKAYRVLVRGTAPEEGVIDHPIPRREGGPRVPAITAFCRLVTLDTEPRHVSWVSASPRTGRLHQVRRHFKHISHPVIGDANYGKGHINRAFRERYGLERMALHAASISFTHPVTNAVTVIEAPLPEDLVGPLSRMGLAPQFFSK